MRSDIGEIWTAKQRLRDDFKARKMAAKAEGKPFSGDIEDVFKGHLDSLSRENEFAAWILIRRVV
jgi:hypothetical protein